MWVIERTWIPSYCKAKTRYSAQDQINKFFAINLDEFPSLQKRDPRRQ